MLLHTYTHTHMQTHILMDLFACVCVCLCVVDWSSFVCKCFFLFTVRLANTSVEISRNRTIFSRCGITNTDTRHTAFAMVNCTVRIVGQYVRLQRLPHSNSPNNLNPCEVQVYGYLYRGKQLIFLVSPKTINSVNRCLLHVLIFPDLWLTVVILGLILQWRHNERHSVSNHQYLDCLLNRLFRLTSKKTSKLCVTGSWGESTGDLWIPLTKGQ